MKSKLQKELIIYQAKNGAIEFRGDFSYNTIWATQKQIAEVFNVDLRTINEHLRNIYRTGELEEKVTIRKFRTVQKEGKRMVKREINFYNLDAIISVGYRVNSKTATTFRIWATKILREHLTKGYTINKKALKKYYQEFLKAVDNIKLLAEKNDKLSKSDVLELIKAFSSTWFDLTSYDKQNFPQKGRCFISQKFNLEKLSQELYSKVEKLKKELMKKHETTELFAQEKRRNSLQGILGDVMQSVFGRDVYRTIEEKAAHLLYFIIKNHPFNDGNKRTGAFAFIWFLQKMNFKFTNKISPETLTVLTLFIAESKPKEKDKMLGLILLLLK